MRKSLLIVFLVLLPLSAQALEWQTPLTDSVTIFETLKINYDVTDEDNPFWAGINRLNLNVAKGPFLAGMRYDTEAYFLEEEYYVRYIPEKVFLQYQSDPFLLRFGDSYASFGQGLTLSLLKRDEFGEDTTIQGALLRINHEYFEFESLIGPVNPGDDRRFGPERAKVEEPEFIDERDMLWGARFMAGPSMIKVGGAWVGGTLRKDETATFARLEEDDRINLYSAIIESPDLAGVGALSGEYAWLEYQDDKKELEDLEWEGRGAHLATTWYAGPVTVLLESTDYFRFDYAYNDPPSMEYPKMSFGHLPNYEDAIGGRGRVDYVVPVVDVGLYVNYTNIQTHEEMPLELADHYSSDLKWLEWIEHTYGGFDRTFGNGSTLTGAAGYREIVEGRYVHGELTFETPIVHPHSLQLEYLGKQFHGFGLMSEVDYASHEAIVSYGYNPYLSLVGSYENSDEPATGTVELGAEEEDDPHFWAAETVVKPTDWMQISLAYGRYKGGLKCAGGVCRPIPPFEGFKSEFAFRF